MAISILFGVLVLGGVVGEYIFGARLSEVAGQLQRMADTEVAQSNKDAAAARKEAEIARKEADSFELDIANAKKAAAEALERAAKAEENLSNARKGAASANERAGNAENETAGLKQRLADRTLTDAQVHAIADKVKLFAGQEFEVTTYWDLKESMAISNRIYDALTLAGWKYLKPERGEALMGGVAGVLVYVHPAAGEQTKKAAAALISALNEESIAAEPRAQNDPANPTNKIHLNIGTKP
jgi:hypothetical protein